MPQTEQDVFSWEETGQGKLFPEQQKLVSGSPEITLTVEFRNLLCSVEELALILNRDLRRLCFRSLTDGSLEVSSSHS
jgi:hypothetical protein